MKKFITILALALVVSLCASFAVSAETTGLGNVSKDVNITFSDVQEDKSAVYSVDVTWTDLAFTYSAGTTTWNPSKHDYSAAGAEGSWSDGTGSVTVTNHSNAAVKADVEFVTASNGNATIAVANGTINLGTAEGTAVAQAPKDTATLTASGAPANSGKIGSIKVTIAAGTAGN